MQIVRELAGYTMGQADNIRRAMSKKKQYVIDAERANFVYGNAEQGIRGCIANGIDEKVANGIYDSMVAFARYAFNKSHAACYAVVAYQTAWLKYYYPTEFMAALMTSVIDNASKTGEYILICRNMGIKMLPPDVNEGNVGFTVSGDSIRYALTAIKGVGKAIVEEIVAERERGGEYTDLGNFIKRNQEIVNKRVVESMIKSGAFDKLGGTRRAYMSAYNNIMDSLSSERKNGISGQLSLFDIAAEDDKEAFDVRVPDMEEYSKETILGFEKDVLGIYVSGHPLEAYENIWRKNITNVATDFVRDSSDTQEGGYQESDMKVFHGQQATIGGMIAAKQVVYTKRGEAMARLTLEDLSGSVNVIVFARSYQKYSSIIKEDAKVFIKGRVQVNEEKDGELIGENFILFDDIPRKVWIKFDTVEEYESRSQELESVIAGYRGKDEVAIFIAEGKKMKVLPREQGVDGSTMLMRELQEKFGKDRVTIK